ALPARHALQVRVDQADQLAEGVGCAVPVRREQVRDGVHGPPGPPSARASSSSHPWITRPSGRSATVSTGAGDSTSSRCPSGLTSNWGPSRSPLEETAKSG